MSQPPSLLFNYSPGVQSLIPLLYVAWADRVLTPTEIGILKGKAAKATFLTEEDKKVLLQWTDPQRPPSPQLFKYWEIELRRAAGRIPEGTPLSLTTLGINMAEQGNRSEGKKWAAPEFEAQLRELEENLSSISIETFRWLFPEASREQAKQTEQQRAGFRPADMATLLDADEAGLKNRLRILLSDAAFRHPEPQDKESYRRQVLHWIELLAEQGLGALAYPSANGGQDDMGAYATAFEMLGYFDLSLTIKFGVQFGLFGGSIHQLGTERHHNRYLEAIGKGKLLGCFAMTETGHGSNVRGLETTAVYLPETGEFLIHSPTREAGKEYIGNALHGAMATVFAQLIVQGENHGVHAILVPLRDEKGRLLPGIQVEDCGYKMGLNGVDNGRIWFDAVRVPRENLLNRFGDVSPEGVYSSPIDDPSRRFFTMLGTLVGGRVCVPRAGLSAAKTGLTIAVKYALKRRQFAPSFHEPEVLLLDYPSHQRRLMPLLAKAYALHFTLGYLTKRYVNHSPDDIREIEAMAAALKAYSTWFTTACLQECREACGGKGYLSENRFDKLKADTDIFTTFEGDNTVLMQLVAKGILSEFRKEFHEEGNRAVLRFVAGRVTTALSERNPVVIRNTSPAHLLSQEFHLNAFRFRERRLLESLSQRIRGWIREGLSAYDAAMKCQTHMIALAGAYAERLTLEQFIEATEKTEGGPREALQRLCQLFALHTIEQHKGWYLENDYLAGVKSKAIRRLVDECCVNVRQDAGALVEAFSIPQECLRAEIITQP
ncbi:MAG: acyl-CoA dehydrogenase family protein [Phaeodactylibacter sp.]|nr:acyl-CoA dehydrogenase family protein [Phaeodactylibacter sp.]MCB9053542.1 acyl-CoA dehydrogenase family protein [Lewinellaceae bacterium]